MKLTTKTRYGIRALVEIAKQGISGLPVKRIQICEIQGIPHAYLENLLLKLKSAKLIKTTRGQSGGFSLRTVPEELNLYQIFTALETPKGPKLCKINNKPCERKTKCGPHIGFEKVFEIEKKALESVTLADLIKWDSEPAAC